MRAFRIKGIFLYNSILVHCCWNSSLKFLIEVLSYVNYWQMGWNSHLFLLTKICVIVFTEIYHKIDLISYSPRNYKLSLFYYKISSSRVFSKRFYKYWKQIKITKSHQNKFKKFSFFFGGGSNFSNVAHIFFSSFHYI